MRIINARLWSCYWNIYAFYMLNILLSFMANLYIKITYIYICNEISIKDLK